jgi:hypothetical protein
MAKHFDIKLNVPYFAVLVGWPLAPSILEGYLSETYSGELSIKTMTAANHSENHYGS